MKPNESHDPQIGLCNLRPGRRYINRDTGFWNDDVEMTAREKKRLYHKFLDDKTPANWQIYKNANPEAKKAVAVTGADHYKNLYDKLDTRDAERDLYRLPKSQHEHTQDIDTLLLRSGQERYFAY